MSNPSSIQTPAKSGPNSRGTALSGSQTYPPLAWNINFEVQRHLPQPGQVLVSEGQRVDSDTVVARTMIPARARLFNLAEYFEIGPHQVERLLVKAINDAVKKGEVIAQGKSVLGKQFRAPFDATLAAFNRETAYLSLSPTPTAFNLDAYVRGQVTQVTPQLGAKIELRANYARGAFGFGGEQHGVLRVIANDPTEPVDPALIEARTSFFILLGGSHVRAEALRKAVEMKVRGIICGSIREEELTKFLQYRRREQFYRVGRHEWHFPADLGEHISPLTLVVTEGFGQRPMAGPVFEMLLAHDGQPLSINGTTKLMRGLQRPEIVAPVSTAGEMNRSSTSLNPADQFPRLGSTVRLTNPSYLGAVGQVRNMAPNISDPNSNSAKNQSKHQFKDQYKRLVGVETNGLYLLVPFADLEVLQL